MTLKIVRSTFADRDLAQVWSHIAADNVIAADGMIRAIDDTLKKLAESPGLGIRLDDVVPGLMCKPVRRKYLIFYSVTGDELRLLRMLHSSRNYEEVF